MSKPKYEFEGNITDQQNKNQFKAKTKTEELN